MAARGLVRAPCPVLLPVTSAKSKKNGPTSTPIANELFENGPIMHEQLATRFIGPFFFCTYTEYFCIGDVILFESGHK